jgi:GT2 family glycosyltransferase
MTDPRFSIVIVNFNYASFLPQAIDSALAQTLPGCEIIVVDDCSTDESHTIIQGYGDRVIPVIRSVNGGMSAAVNSGFLKSSAPIVLFLDADDFLYPHAAEQVMSAWSSDVAQVQARLDLVDIAGRVEDVFPPYEFALDHGDVSAELCYRGRYSTTVTTGLAFSRKALGQVMPIPELAFDRSADGFLATVVPLYGNVVAIDKPIGAYRRHDSNHSGFGANIAKRARWRVNHDEHRYTALRDHAGRRGLTVSTQPGMLDGTHLEQRLASLCFEPQLHPYAGDRRGTLGRAGARAAFASSMSFKRRATNAAIFLAAGFSPRFIARSVLAWKLERSSRPQAIDWLAGRLRRLMG